MPLRNPVAADGRAVRYINMNIKKITNKAESLLSKIAGEEATEKFWVTHYGANHIHSKYLVFWISVESDKERDRLQSDKTLINRLRQVLIDVNYPEEGRDSVQIGFESQETVNRESNGNWYQHWKKYLTRHSSGSENNSRYY